MRTAKLIALCISMIITSSQAVIIYQDTFSGTAAPLEGRLAESGGSAGEEWLTKEGFETDGSIALITTNASRSAALPFLPMTGERYRLSADISVAVDAWAAFGFIAENNVVNGREFFFNLIDNPAPWLNLKPDGTLNTFGGPLTGNKVSFSGMGTYGTVMIELDTRETNWIATYYFNGTPLRTNTFSGALYEINYIGFGNYSPANMTVDNFKLETIDQNAEVSITHNTYVPIYDFTLPSSDVDFFHRYLDEFDLHAYRLREDSDNALQKAITLHNTYGYRLTCTSSDLCYQSTNATQSGEICAQIVLDSVERLYSFTGEVIRIYIDHPWQLRWQENPTNSLQVVPTGMTMQQSVDEIIDFMEAIHSEYPDWEFFLLPNLSNYGWKGQRSYRSPSGESLGVGDFYDEMTLVYSNALAAELSLSGVLIDYPYPSAMGITVPVDDVYNGSPDEFDWMALIRDVENEVETRGMEFGIINNSYAGPANQGYTFYIDSLDYIDVYTDAPYYGSPALWAPRTWYLNKPPEQVPEVCLINSGSTNYTMSAIVNATMDRVKRPEIDGQFQAFNVDDNAQGWTTRVNITNYEVIDGYFWGTSTSADPYMIKTGVSISGSNLPYLEIALAANDGTTAQFYFKVDGNSSWQGPVNFSITSDAEIHVYELDLSANSVWTGTNRINTIRIDPCNASSADFAIDYIWIHPDFD